MDSKKVKEIRKALQYNILDEFMNRLPYGDEFNKLKMVSFEDILTLINELESENETFLKSKTMWKRLHTELCKENQTLKDRIAELEKENKDYYDRLDNLQTYIDNHEGVWKGNTKIQLKQFAERVKGKFEHCVGDIYHADTIDERIDKTLKEFLDTTV